jgi:2-polyprenyl-3-methyl-5-hydroxy-6-metoxy-1,4-benzoquinol methylase
MIATFKITSYAPAMILCPKCHDQELQNYSCQSCSHSVELREQTPFFHPEAIEDFADHSHESLVSIEKGEKSHFWFRTRFEFITSIFSRFINKNSRCLEIGGGTGGVSKYLTDHGHEMAVGEIQPIGLEFARKKGISERYQFDLFRPIFKKEFDCIALFDVLEHLDNEKAALTSIHQMLKTDGKVVLTVPAHNWLWNRRDLLEKHKRRYEISYLKKLFENNGYKITYASHFFVAILPLLFIRALLTKNDLSEPTKEEQLGSINMNPILNFILYWVTHVENKILRYLSSPIGGSIILVAQKV